MDLMQTHTHTCVCRVTHHSPLRLFTRDTGRSRSTMDKPVLASTASAAGVEKTPTGSLCFSLILALSCSIAVDD